MAAFMGKIIFEYLPGATPLNPDESAGLMPRHITTQSQLNEWEQNNILDAEQWMIGKKFLLNQIATRDFICSVHRRMFAKTWKWAGDFRQSNKNIGVDWLIVSVELKKLCDDLIFQIEKNVFGIDEAAMQFHHRLVLIHPFPNGNGRHARLMTDIFLLSQRCERFLWGDHQSMTSTTVIRKNYIEALRAADRGDYGLLKVFLRR